MPCNTPCKYKQETSTAKIVPTVLPMTPLFMLMHIAVIFVQVVKIQYNQIFADR